MRKDKKALADPTAFEVLKVLKTCVADQKPLRLYEELTLTWSADIRCGFAPFLAGAYRDNVVFASHQQTSTWVENLGKKKGK